MITSATLRRSSAAAPDGATRRLRRTSPHEMQGGAGRRCGAVIRTPCPAPCPVASRDARCQSQYCWSVAGVSCCEQREAQPSSAQWSLLLPRMTLAGQRSVDGSYYMKLVRLSSSIERSKAARSRTGSRDACAPSVTSSSRSCAELRPATESKAVKSAVSGVRALPRNRAAPAHAPRVGRRRRQPESSRRREG